MATFNLGTGLTVAVYVEMDGLCWKKNVTTITVYLMMGVPVSVKLKGILSVLENPVFASSWAH